MAAICDADLTYLKPGKKVVLKSYQGLLLAPHKVLPADNYWRLLGKKATVVELEPGLVKQMADSSKNQRVLLTFDEDFKSLGLVSPITIKNSLWVLVTDLKFVCRY